MGDRLAELPTDTIPPSSDEKDMLGWLFEPQQKLQSNVRSLWAEFQNLLFLGLLFIIFWLPPVDNLLGTVVPFAKTSFIGMIILRTLIFLNCYWLFLNFKFL